MRALGESGGLELGQHEDHSPGGRQVSAIRPTLGSTGPAEANNAGRIFALAVSAGGQAEVDRSVCESWRPELRTGFGGLPPVRQIEPGSLGLAPATPTSPSDGSPFGEYHWPDEEPEAEASGEILGALRWVDFIAWFMANMLIGLTILGLIWWLIEKAMM